MAKNGKKLWTTAEVARQLGRHPHTIRLWAKAGRLPYFQIGEQMRFDPEEILAIKAKTRIEATAAL